MAAGIPVFSKNETSGSKIASGPSIRRGAGVPQLFADDCACTPYSRYLDDAFMIISAMSLNSPEVAREKLLQAHKFLDRFRAAENGNEKLQKVLLRYNAMIKAKQKKERLKSMIIEQSLWQDRLRNRPIMTGGFLKPTILNPPLPRLKPQPLHISMMMYRRRVGYERMAQKYIRLKGYQEDLGTEVKFEEALLSELRSQPIRQYAFEPAFYTVKGWGLDVAAQRFEIGRSMTRGVERATTQYPPELLEQIREARREKIRNKTRERERERRGDYSRNVIKRNRKRAPAHILETMSENRRRADATIRSASEVGYVGMTKSRLGVKMKNPNLWRELEEGNGEKPEFQAGCSSVRDKKDQEGEKEEDQDELASGQ
ncbi:hypothetical protein A7U60_g3696 [Sanghuangporus baumii]|uniref:Uncharacterized protein n=1 Tax=Sanghuangporus baumii TaxID=108892 RepID=A0A9Q5I0F9_SANBA|nr:hypothetical protein A7U60_g3696 [Sanghuangporus baumii]